MSNETLLEDDGYMAVQVKGADGSQGEARIDVFETAVALDANNARHPDDVDARLKGIHAIMDGFGTLPPRSGMVAVRFAKAVYARLDELKKGGGGGSTPSSPVSTAPTP